MATPTPWLPVLCNIAPPPVRRKEALRREYTKIVANHSLPIHQDFPPALSRLKSRKPPLRLASQLCTGNYSTHQAWYDQWETFDGTNEMLVNDPANEVYGMSLPRKEWSLLNRFRTGVGRCNSWKFKWGQSVDPSCDCGVRQTMHHIAEKCHLRSFSGGLRGLHNGSVEGLQWLIGLDLAL